MKKRRYAQLFLSTLRLSACTFGGGFVIVALMRRRFVEELKWIDEREMLDMTAIAQSAPGAVAVNASILVGYHVAGLPGAAVTLLGAVLPPLVIISVISLFYQAFRQSETVNRAMMGMLCGVAAVIADVTLSMVHGLMKLRRTLPLFVLAGAFIAVRILRWPIAAMLPVCGIIGLLDARAQRGRGRKDAF